MPVVEGDKNPGASDGFATKASVGERTERLASPLMAQNRPIVLFSVRLLLTQSRHSVPWSQWLAGIGNGYADAMR